jgi:hypothetical protein
MASKSGCGWYSHFLPGLWRRASGLGGLYGNPSGNWDGSCPLLVTLLACCLCGMHGGKERRLILMKRLVIEKVGLKDIHRNNQKVQCFRYGMKIVTYRHRQTYGVLSQRDAAVSLQALPSSYMCQVVPQERVSKQPRFRSEPRLVIQCQGTRSLGYFGEIRFSPLLFGQLISKSILSTRQAHLHLSPLLPESFSSSQKLVPWAPKPEEWKGRAAQIRPQGGFYPHRRDVKDEGLLITLEHPQ